MASVLPYAARGGSLAKRAPGLAAVLVLHLFLGWALVTGLARRVIEVVKAPIETRVIEEIKKPPPDLPPPPPPKLAAPPPPFIPPPEIDIQVPQAQTQPAITAVTTTRPPAPQVIAPPAPKPAAPPVRKEFKAAYRVEPQFPRLALRQGLSGRVVAHVYVEPGGRVSEVKIVSSSNRIFDGEVVRALSQWKFNPEPVGFIGEYEIVFNLKD